MGHSRNYARRRQYSGAEPADQDTRRKRQRGNPSTTIASPDDLGRVDNPPDSPSDGGSKNPYGDPSKASIDGKNTWTVLCEAHPELKLDAAVLPREEPLDWLAALPARNRLARNLLLPQKPLSLEVDRIARLKLVLGQIAGTKAANRKACHTSCMPPRGRWYDCVVPPTGSMPYAWKGACANCIDAGKVDSCCLLDRANLERVVSGLGGPSTTPNPSGCDVSAPPKTCANHENDPLSLDDFDSSLRTILRMPLEEKQEALKVYRKRAKNADLIVDVLEAMTSSKES